MILKDAFRYQNYLESLLGKIESYLRITDNTMVTSEDHLCAEAKEGMQNEHKDNRGDRDFNVPVDAVINFAVEVLDEKIALSKKISAAKAAECPTLDSEVAMNTTRRGLADTFKRLVAQKGRDWIKSAQGYCFNSEGNQVPYWYKVKYSSKVDYSKVKVKELLNKLTADSDNISNMADYYLSTVQVDYTPKYSYNDSFEELLEMLSSTDMAS